MFSQFLDKSVNYDNLKKRNLNDEWPAKSNWRKELLLSRFQIVIDVKEPARLVNFWSQALGYVPEPPPRGFSSWVEFYTKIGLPKEELTVGHDSIVDPHDKGPRIWFHVVPESKICKNRIHFDLGVSGGYGVPMNIRKERVEAEAERLVKIGATRLETLEEAGVEHYAVAMADPEDNEFDIN